MASLCVRHSCNALDTPTACVLSNASVNFLETEFHDARSFDTATSFAMPVEHAKITAQSLLCAEWALGLQL